MKRFLSIKKSRGFTLIELLIVIAILGLLATVVFVNLNPGTNLTRTRDTRRLADLDATKTALELYALANASNNYPASLANLVPNYLPSVPTDPTGASYSYCLATGSKGYGMGIDLESTGADLTGYMRTSVALVNMPAGCTLNTNFTPNIACEAPAGAGGLYCTRQGV